MHNPDRPILIVAPAWVGDMVMAHSLIRLLKQQRPERPIDVLAPRSTLPLAERMQEVREGILMASGHGQLQLQYRKHLGRQLRKRGYGQALVLPNSLKSALVPFFADIEQRTGYRGEYRYFLLNDMRLLSKRKTHLMVNQFAMLALRPGQALPDPLPYPRLSVDPTNRNTLLESLGLASALQSDSEIIGLCPGAEYGPAKQWPAEHFASLATSLIDKGKQVWVFGGAGDRAIGHQIVTQVNSDSCIDLTGKTSLLEAIDLLSVCQAVVTNDSGLMHVACALGLRTIAIYGSTTPEFTPPLADNAVMLSLALACSPCFRRQCPLGHTNCLKNLAPGKVIEALEKN
ncbi:MAG: lipopolysaccharide heptosyltransferase II [Gammaproteobacteria bacterium]|nr:lipopolysaccharide heptosyltransferase II [Gammaproteobacteria bacterium]